MVKTLIITGYGINAEAELAEAFRLSGSEVTSLHINDLIKKPETIRNYHIIGFPGGFSFGDHIGSGQVFSHLSKNHLKDHLEKFLSSGKLMIGICNGFQVLTKMGVLPNFSRDWTQEVSLIHNDHGKFEDSWVTLKANQASNSAWLKGIEALEVPIRHGEGRFITRDEEIASKLNEENCIALTYEGRNPNGSEMDIAGITDSTGRVLGLMPHPEAFLIPQNHPRWTREEVPSDVGLAIFRNGVKYAKENLL